MKKKLDILTVSKDRLNSLRKNISSIKSQTVREDFNHLLVDGKSIDGTFNLLAEHFDNAVQITDVGLYNALNQAHAYLSADYMMYLHSDDILLTPQTSELILNKIRDDQPDVMFFNVIISRSRASASPRLYKSSMYKFRLMKWGIMPAHTGMVIRRKLLDELGEYDETFKIAADFELLYRLFLKRRALSIRFYDDYIVTMQAGGASTGSIWKKITIIREQARVLKSYNVRLGMFRVLTGKFIKFFDNIIS